MMLFAEDPAQPATVASVLGNWVGPLLATVGAVAAAAFSWLSSRDKLRFDADCVQMRADIVYLKAASAECHKEKAEAEQERDAFRRDLDDMRRRLDDNSGQYRALSPGQDRRRVDDPDYPGPERRDDPPKKEK